MLQCLDLGGSKFLQELHCIPREVYKLVCMYRKPDYRLSTHFLVKICYILMDRSHDILLPLCPIKVKVIRITLFFYRFNVKI